MNNKITIDINNKTIILLEKINANDLFNFLTTHNMMDFTITYPEVSLRLPNGKVTNTQLITELKEQGLTNIQIAKKFNCSERTIYRILDKMINE